MLDSIWLIGCGNMAGAMLARWLEAGVSAERFTIVRPSGQVPAAGVRTLYEVPQGEPTPAMLMLGIKPFKLDEVAPSLLPVLGRQTVLVSILAGVEIASLRKRFAAPEAIVRAMPNLPVRLGKGVTGLVADGASENVRADLDRLMAHLGLVEWVESEAVLDALSVLAGSGPAFMCRFIDALARAGEGIGLSQAQAARLALATAEGAAALAAGSDESPGRIAERVASPGGSTRKGLDMLDADDRLLRLLDDTLGASRRRVAQMADEARGSQVDPPGGAA